MNVVNSNVNFKQNCDLIQDRQNANILKLHIYNLNVIPTHNQVHSSISFDKDIQ